MVFMCNKAIDIYLYSFMAYHVEFGDGNDSELEAFDFVGIPFDASQQSPEFVSHFLSIADSSLGRNSEKLSRNCWSSKLV